MFDFFNTVIVQQAIQASIIIIVAFVLVKIFSKLLGKFVGEKTESRKHILQNIKRFNQLIIYISALVLVLWVFEVDVTGLVAGLGVGALIIGFALKDFIENWVSGLLIVSGRTYKVGDVIQVGEFKGVVVEVSLRTTSLKTFDQNKIIIPNSLLLKEKIVNLTDGQKETVTSVVFCIDYTCDVDRAKALVDSVLRSNSSVVVNDKRKREIRFLVRSKDWTVEIEVLFWINVPKREEFVKSEVVEAVKKCFDEEKIFPPIPAVLRRDFLENKKNK